MNILLIVGGILAALVAFTVVKKLIKMMFVFIVLLVIGLGIFFLMYQSNPEMFSAPSVETDPTLNIQEVQPLSPENQEQLLQATEEIRQKAAEEVNKAVLEAQQIMQEGIEKRRPRPSQQENEESTEKIEE